MNPNAEIPTANPDEILCGFAYDSRSERVYRREIRRSEIVQETFKAWIILESVETGLVPDTFQTFVWKTPQYALEEAIRVFTERMRSVLRQLDDMRRRYQKDLETNNFYVYRSVDLRAPSSE